MPNRKWQPAYLIVCSKCKQLGGTLRKVGDAYEHNVCPKVARPGTKVELVMPKSQLWEARKKIPKSTGT